MWIGVRKGACVCASVCVWACVCAWARARVLDFHLRLLLLYGHLKFCTSLEIEQLRGLFICLRYCASSTPLGFVADLMRGGRLCCCENFSIQPQRRGEGVPTEKKRRMRAMKMAMEEKRARNEVAALSCFSHWKGMTTNTWGHFLISSLSTQTGHIIHRGRVGAQGGGLYSTGKAIHQWE